MPDPDALSRPVYDVAGAKLSLLDLLRRFTEPQFQHDGVWRLSDLHLKVGEPACYRHDNEVVPLKDAGPITAETMRHLLAPMLTEAQRAGLGSGPPIDVDAGFEVKELGLSFRINAFHDREGLACAIRILPKSVPDVAKIGFPTEESWKEIVDLRQGLVIVTGITGSGKSTTVASLLQQISRSRRLRILTLEDPIEYVIPSVKALVSQRELGRHFPTFEMGLRSALREDPDVIFVGEMRDRETASLALTAAETGHLVLSTLHTKDAKGVVTRIGDMFQDERAREITAQLSFSLAWVLAQKLVPRASGKGRRVAMEVLKNIPAVSNLIRNGRWQQIYSTMEAHRKEGIVTLEKHLTDLARAGEITKETAQRYANDPELVG
jgi:twitching motility protein PilT